MDEILMGQVDRQPFEDEIFRLIGAIDSDMDEFARAYGIDYENDIFVMRKYSWDFDDVSDLPNFEYKPDNFIMTWYKYPLRAALMKEKVTIDEFKIIIDICIESLK